MVFACAVFTATAVVCHAAQAPCAAQLPAEAMTASVVLQGDELVYQPGEHPGTASSDLQPHALPLAGQHEVTHAVMGICLTSHDAVQELWPAARLLTLHKLRPTLASYE